MLSRIGNSLFWMGRYLERAEHLARYLHVHYYAALDAPLAQKQEFTYDSILRLLGVHEEHKRNHKKFTEDAFDYYIALDEHNLSSIRSSVNLARENARGARDSISSELWGAINKFYHYVNALNEQSLKKEGISLFSEKVMEYCAIVNAHSDNSLTHDETWSLIRLGSHTERASQIARILYAKIIDIQKTQKQKLGKSIESYQCVTLLKSAEAFDMSRIYYRQVPGTREALEFLILNRSFPRSITYNLRHIKNGITRLSRVKNVESGSLEFAMGKLYNRYDYMTIEEVLEDVPGFLEKTLEEIYSIAARFEKENLSY